MIYDLFRSQFSMLPKKERSAAEEFLRVATALFGEEPNFEDKSKIIQLFYGKNKKMNKTKFYQNKKFVSAFYDILLNQGAISQELHKYVKGLCPKDVIATYETSRFFFKSLDDTLEFISMIGHGAGLSGSEDMNFYKALAILAWNNMTVEQMVNIKKRDLIDGSCSIRCGEHVIVLAPQYYEVIKLLAVREVYRVFPTGAEFVRAESEYVFRTKRLPKMSGNNIICMLRRLNSVTEKYGREISLHHIQKCGMFERIRNVAGESVATSKVKEVVGGDAALACRIREFYEQWIECYYKEG